MTTKYTCPCCGYRTLDEKSSWEICHICGWEDDPLQSENIDISGGANIPSLRQAQKNFIEFGACEKEMICYTLKPDLDDIKDKDWKPISE